MAIDWKTIISEFDGKPTLLQAIGKLRKAVEDETITIQQAQAEIAKLESQQKADEALINTKQDKLNDKSDLTVAWLTANGVIAESVKAGDVSDDEDNIYNFPKKAGTFALTSDVVAVETKAQQALDLAMTNETDIATLDGQVAELETKTQILPDEKPTYQMVLCINPNNKIFFIPFTASILKNAFPNFDKNGRLHSTNGADESDDTAVATMYEITTLRQEVINRIGAQQFKTIFGNQSIVGTGNIDLYRHDIAITFSNADSNDIHVEFISSKNTVCDSLQDLKTVLGDSFRISANGGVFGIFDGLSTEFVAEYMRETGIQTFYKDTGSDFGVKFISFADNPFSLSDTVTTI